MFTTVSTYSIILFHVARVEEIKTTGKTQEHEKLFCNLTSIDQLNLLLRGHHILPFMTNEPVAV